MDWWLSLSLLLGGVLILLMMGVPIALSFMGINVLGLVLLIGGTGALDLIISGTYDSLSSFVLLALPMFIFMGEIMTGTGLVARGIDALDKWIGGIPGRLGILAVITGTIFAALSGSTMAGTATLGSTLVPEMIKRGYSKTMAIGSVMAAGGLAMVIPPSALGILLAVLAKISIAKLFIAGVTPGLLMAFLYTVCIIGVAWFKPHLAPKYAAGKVTVKMKFAATKDILPLVLLIFAVLGGIYAGVVTPTEAAAFGALCGAFFGVLTSIAYGVFDLKALWKAALVTAEITGMMFLIIAGSQTFSSILAFTGASKAIVNLATGLSAPPLAIVVAMQVVILVLGCFIDGISIMMITVPIYIPIVEALGFDTLWFSLLMLLSIEVGDTSPPFGVNLFVMKAVYPQASMTEIYIAALPFILIDLFVITLMLLFPAVVLWLPAQMG